VRFCHSFRCSVLVDYCGCLDHPSLGRVGLGLTQIRGWPGGSLVGHHNRKTCMFTQSQGKRGVRDEGQGFLTHKE
jgi:hypothetical protein